MQGMDTHNDSDDNGSSKNNRYISEGAKKKEFENLYGRKANGKRFKVGRSTVSNYQHDQIQGLERKIEDLEMKIKKLDNCDVEWDENSAYVKGDVYKKKFLHLTCTYNKLLRVKVPSRVECIKLKDIDQDEKALVEAIVNQVNERISNYNKQKKKNWINYIIPTYVVDYNDVLSFAENYNNKLTEKYSDKFVEDCGWYFTFFHKILHKLKNIIFFSKDHVLKNIFHFENSKAERRLDQLLGVS